MPRGWDISVQHRDAVASRAMMLRPGHRYRCGACGNLTRFDEEAKRHTRRFLHFSMAGDPEILEEEILGEELIALRCRWCGSGDAIEQVPALEVE
jgi:hypothetical protein